MKKRWMYLVVAVMFNAIGFYILSPEVFNVCENSCFTNSTTFGLGQPLFFGMIPVTIALLMLLFVRGDRIVGLYKLLPVYFLGSIIVLYFIPINCNALDPICITKSTVAIFLGAIFLVMSVIKVLKK